MTIDELNTLTTKTFVWNEDWKTSIAHNQGPIPPNTKVKFKEVYYNYYGRWLEVEYNDEKYYVDPSKLEGDYVEGREQKYDIAACRWFTIINTRKGKRYLLEEGGMLKEL